MIQLYSSYRLCTLLGYIYWFILVFFNHFMDRAKHRTILKETLFQSAKDFVTLVNFTFQQEPLAKTLCYVTGILSLQSVKHVAKIK